MSSARSQQERLRQSRQVLAPPKLKDVTSIGSNTTEITCASTECSGSLLGWNLSSQFPIREEENDEINEEQDQVEMEQDDDDVEEDEDERNDDHDDDDDDENIPTDNAMYPDEEDDGIPSIPAVASLVDHNESEHCHVQETPIQLQNMGAMYFGWIRHEATKLWRLKVKVFSDNRNGYPKWDDQICEHVKSLLADEGVHWFKVGRDKHKKTPLNKICPGEWREATAEEVLEKTKQRFNDDRKPRKELPKPTKRRRVSNDSMQEPAMEPQAAVALPTSVDLRSLEQDLSKYRTRMGHWLTLHDTHTEQSHRLAQLRQQLYNRHVNIPCEETARLLQVSQDVECVHNYLCFQMEAALGNTLPQATTDSALDPPSNGFPVEQFQAGNANLLVPALGGTLRQPRFPTESHDICFDWENHKGTKRWTEVVREVSERFAMWDEQICELVKAKLVDEGFNNFCSFLNALGEPCDSIKVGTWCDATEEEIRYMTMLQYFGMSPLEMSDLRDLLRDDDDGAPPSGGSTGSHPPPDGSDNNDDFAAEDQFTGGQNENGSNAGPPFGHQNNLSLAPVAAAAALCDLLLAIDSEQGTVPAIAVAAADEEAEHDDPVSGVVAELLLPSPTFEKVEEAERNDQCETDQGVVGESPLPSPTLDKVEEAERNDPRETDRGVAGESPLPSPTLDKEESRPTVQELNPEDDGSSVGSDSAKVSIEGIQNPIFVSDVNVLGLSGHVYRILSPELQKLENIEMDERLQTLTFGSVLVDQRPVDGPALTDIAKTQLEKTLVLVSSDQQQSKQRHVTVPPPLLLLSATTSLSSSKEGSEVLPTTVDVAAAGPPGDDMFVVRPGAVRVRGPYVEHEDRSGAVLPLANRPRYTYVEDDEHTGASVWGAYVEDDEDADDGDDVESIVSASTREVVFVNNTLVGAGYRDDDGEESVVHDITPTNHPPIVSDRLRPICNLMVERDAYTVISEKLAKPKWRRVLTTLDAQEFGSLIANVNMDFDRPRVAELLAGQMLDQQGAPGFTCEHAASAIQNTRFRGIMAERILPYCVDLSSNISIVKNELQDWDVLLLLLSLCRKLQASEDVTATTTRIDAPRPCRRSIQQRLRASLKFIRKTLVHRRTTRAPPPPTTCVK